jgi:hypothetical protein
VHNNTLEGIWTGVRNFLRIFRGVNKDYLGQYIGIFEWSYKIKAVALEFLRAFLTRLRLRPTRCIKEDGSGRA